MKETKGPRRVLGLRLPYLMSTVVDITEKAAEWIEDALADPHAAIEAQIAGLEEDAEQERCQASDAAVKAGSRLLWLRRNPGDGGFANHLTRLKISQRTARNKMALALFARMYPELYSRLRCLGPTKLYRIAVLNPEKIHKISVDDVIEIPRGKVRLRQLTSREFEDWLRDQVPVAEREPWIRRAAAICAGPNAWSSDTPINP
jgi:hypothetical protein